MNESLKLPGLSNAWTMPIKGRIDMLTTGIRTPVGLKISGANLVQIEQIGGQVEAILRQMKGTRSVFAERTGGGYFLDIDWKRDELARYGLTIDQAQEAVQNAIGGENIATTIQGRERYAVNIRYKRDFRSNMEAIGRVMVAVAGSQKQISLSQLADVSVVSGPAMIQDEDGLLTGYVYVDISGQDPGSYIREADGPLRAKVMLSPGAASTRQCSASETA
jgi:Cu(I)/Ag(I) efflux system membrane protein CusA/SilA